MTNSQIHTLAKITNNLDKIVQLKEDEVSVYISSAFNLNKIPNNRCLCNFSKKLELNKLYFLSEFTCEGKCSIGDTNNCDYAKPWWTYDNPIKCACWNLQLIELNLTPTIDELIKNNII